MFIVEGLVDVIEEIEVVNVKNIFYLSEYKDFFYDCL